jgi:hypothetical protein
LKTELDLLIRAIETVEGCPEKIMEILRRAGTLRTLSDSMTCTTKDVAKFFDVSVDMVWARLQAHRVQLVAAGYRVDGRYQLSATFPELRAAEYRKIVHLGVWPPLAVLPLGTHLAWTPTAERLRTILASLDSKMAETPPSLDVGVQLTGEKTTRAPSSHFDAIRRTRTDGTEYWSARELMSMMGYTQANAWQKFKVPLERAMKAAKHRDLPLTSHFIRSDEKYTGGRPAMDYELSRMGAYLVAMNGDPNKEEVCGAQVYFAAKTREAEVTEEAIAHSTLAAQDGGAQVYLISRAHSADPIATTIARARCARACMKVVALAKGILPDAQLEAEAKRILAEMRSADPQAGT